MSERIRALGCIIEKIWLGVFESDLTDSFGRMYVWSDSSKPETEVMPHEASASESASESER